ncbi:MAG TPA: hypothetical protein VF721_00525 [Pyrinomonadaceae bacterium]|jgi:hypothetical protein
MKFARYTFLIAGIYGLLVLAPMYFLEAKTGQDFPPAITHAEYYYGFIGVALAWQIVFLMISQNPARYRPLMPVAAVFEKFSFGIAAIVLFLQNRLHAAMLGAGILDLILGALFVVSFLKTKEIREA